MTAAAIEIKALSKSFLLKRSLLNRRGQWLHAVCGINLTVYQGETMGVVGESGSGKTTLAKMLVGLTPPDEGSITIAGETFAAISPAARGKKIQYVFQDAMGSLNPRKTISDSLHAPLIHLRRLPAAERERRICEILRAVNLREDCLSRHPHRFSGGQAQRIGIARALLAAPEIMVLDEPVSALDVSVQAQVLNLLADIKTRFSLTYVLISHDLAVVESASDRVAVMYCGEIVEISQARRIFSKPRHPYTRLLADSAPVPGKSNRGELIAPDIINSPAGCAFAPRCRKATEHCRTHKPVLAQHENEHHVACHFPD